MVGEEDLRLCLGWSAGFDLSISDSTDQLPLSSDSRDPCTQDRRRGEREEKGHGKESDEEEGEGVGASGAGRKKLRLSREQASVLEGAFRQHHTLNPKQKLALAKELNLKPRQVEVWFQNRRARTKLKKTEVDCELLKRCCEKLTEENRRLQGELLELRALKRPPPQVYMQAWDLPSLLPTTILAVCPTCERAAPSKAAAPPAESKYGRSSASLPHQPTQILLS